MTDPIWCVMPVLAGPEMTEAAISDLLGQSVPVKLLIINQGVEEPFRDRLERIAEQDARIYLWHHQPPLPSLSASWNLGLELAWHSGGQVALVVNNDVRLQFETVAALATVLQGERALFVSAVGVTRQDFEFTYPGDGYRSYAGGSTVGHLSDFVRGLITPPDRPTIEKGGPDFSCFLISRECHQCFPFDEHFIPAFCEDLDYHRRLMLAGEGSRIFSVNLPYLHLASQTLQCVGAAEAERIRQAIEMHSRAYYARKWGGPVNAETFWRPFDKDHDVPVPGYFSDPTTPALQRAVQAREQRNRSWQDLRDSGGLPEAQDAAAAWADSNQQEDERAQGAEQTDRDPGAAG